MNETQRLIIDLFDKPRPLVGAEIQQLIAHVVSTPFSSRTLKINQWLHTELQRRDVNIQSLTMPSIELHLLKRIYFDQQWPSGTTATQYLHDLQQAVRHPGCQIWTYRWIGEAFVGFFAPSHIQHVPKPESLIFIAYSATYDRIKTGYQVTGTDAVFTDEFAQLTRQR